ncbi:X2-like carbohydrate binding domain-containing protein [Paenibacillus guangzhouensis]|uniref:X2-like carbohydrate binding domain-containing protein n=1 Tax=Paenibacillus guangzhouensis TaxID=1473112 RepID=UPI0012676235|nr:X2-like carbohydrate binding domain-containing protein [Paenibacillus guangzhouensis]
MKALNKWLFILLAFLIIGAAIPQEAIAASTSGWEQRSPLPTRNTFNDVAYVNNLFVAVGDMGTIATSEDGISWVPQNSGTYATLESVTYGNGKYVAVGAYGTILTSTDGVTWSSQKVGDKWLYGVAFGNNKFVAVGIEGTILISTDAMTWTAKTGVTDRTLYDITFGNGWFVASGQNRTTVGSDTTVNWNGLLGTGGENYLGVIYGGNNNRYVVVGSSGEISYSMAIGRNQWIWTSGKASGNAAVYGFSDVAYGNNKFVAVGNGGKVYTASSYANVWQEQNSGWGNNLEGVTYGKNMFVAVGRFGTILTSADGGVTWTNRSQGTIWPVRDIGYYGHNFIAVGQIGNILNSSDGARWQKQAMDSSIGFESVSYGNGTYVAVGPGNVVMTSPNGMAWTSRASGGSWTDTYYGLTFGEGKFVAVKYGGKIRSSLDGVTWTDVTSPTTNTLNAIRYGEHMFVAVGDGGHIVTSPDGDNWTLQSSGTQSNLKAIEYGNGEFVAVGDTGVILTSADGVNWVKRNSGISSLLNGVGYGNGTYIAVGNTGVILSSTNGADWTPMASGTQEDLYTAAFGDNTFVAGGNMGTILSLKVQPNSAIDPSNAKFDLYIPSEDHREVKVTLQLNGNALTLINNQAVTLTQGTDYSISGDTVRIKKSYLSSLPVGTTTLTFTFSAGAAQILTIDIIDSTPRMATVSYEPGDHGTISGSNEQVTIGGHPSNVPSVTPATGYRFIGWSSNGGHTLLSSGQVTATPVTADVAYTAYYAKIIMGDADGDGKVTPADALLLTQYIKGKITLTPEQLQGLDMNGDGQWDDSDVKAILAICTGKG